MRVYEEIKTLRLRPTVSTLNALVASLCMKSFIVTFNSKHEFATHFELVSLFVMASLVF